MLKRFFQRHINALGFWWVVIFVAATLAYAAYVILPPAPSPVRPAPMVRP